MFFLFIAFEGWSLGIKTIWVLAHKEFLAPKYAKREAQKHSKGFFMFFFLSQRSRGKVQ